MSFYQAIVSRLEEEQDYKKQWIYDHMGKALVTRFFPTGQAYSNNWEGRSISAKALSPTMFTPWGKVLGDNARVEQKNNSAATFTRALKSIPAQLLYDVFNMVLYIVAALPSLIIGAGYLVYGTYIEKNEQNQKNQIQFAQEKCFGNVVLAAYFALAIVIDFIREFGALFSRTYATIMETDEERNTPYCTMG